MITHGISIGIHAGATTLGILIGLAIIAAPIAATAAIIRLLWVGPLAKMGWRVAAWRLARRFRRSRLG